MVYIYVAAAVTAAAADIITDVINKMELKVRVKIQQPKELKVLFIAIYY